jgi:hypothetical protein
MGKTTNRPVNGAMISNEAVLSTPIIPVKTEAQLLLELEIDKLKAENEALRSKPQTGLSLRISEKGALSVYGMGRFPFTLYVEQWQRLFQAKGDIEAFMKANDSRLKRKGQE